MSIHNLHDARMQQGDLGPCREAALALHPGTVERSSARVRQDGNHYIFLIRRHDNDTEWLIACHAESAKIVKAVGLDWL